MKHSTKIKHYTGNHAQLAEEIGDLYYNSLAEFISLLATKIAGDAKADEKRGRPKLAAELVECSRHLESASSHIRAAWHICEPYAHLQKDKT